MKILINIPTKSGSKDIVKEWDDISLSESLAKYGKAPMLLAVTHSGFPPANWAEITELKEEDIYSNELITEEEYNTIINKIVKMRRERALVLDCI